jgi:hypothetical protein
MASQFGEEISYEQAYKQAREALACVSDETLALLEEQADSEVKVDAVRGERADRAWAAKKAQLAGRPEGEPAFPRTL